MSREKFVSPKTENLSEPQREQLEYSMTVEVFLGFTHNRMYLTRLHSRVDILSCISTCQDGLP